ncbi:MULTISPECIES: GTPase-associated system all-helical protein GASH [unclassified Bradyrhizobium]|uniref:GTPase-associated system all-helical protein GASH n=1 Tax=unclassified Bradyrhizobium TaxID=2631580 RepID=UPI001FF84E97|nr:MULTISPECIES: GTPase-associated system all-helical protein GASH [unclassified Bradyrhizobium]MCK1418136.1 hypothetical protein [Bradyrhizobium sp. CW4]MCK1430566.1 hypothetical protein [Bradyrhizobium sp. 87]
MAEESVPPMRGEFPRWYRTVDVSENRARLDNRWKGVASLAKAADSAGIETMLALLLKSKSRPGDAAMAVLREHFRAADDLFDMADNDRELEILCGAALATILDGDGDIAVEASLKTSGAFFVGSRKATFPFDLAAAAEVAIARIADGRRTRPTIGRVADVGRTGLDQATRDKMTKEGFSIEVVMAGIDNLTKYTNSVMADVVRKTNAALAGIDDFVAVQDEELQMLWWLFGARSKTLDRPFVDVPADAQPIIFAAELADATRKAPGPSSVKPILSRAGLKECKKTAISTAINACDVSFLRTLVVDGAKPSAVTQPIHFAIQRKLEVGDDTSWPAAWSAITGIDSDLAVAGIDLGNLFYRERLGIWLES